MAARKTNNGSKAKASAPIATTPVRNTSIPPRTASPVSSPKKSPTSYDQIAKRAYDIWQSGKGGNQNDNWYRAERELRG
ncbi:MAG TPA: DUF2934 domain-containing protein [Tepidisphaeraceae bacterium]|jgi:hypothetical protein